MKPDERPLESWKEIAAHLKRDVTTVRRWEKSQGLPVRRHLHESRSSVFAYPSELDEWWAGRTPAENAADLHGAGPARLRVARIAALAAAVLTAVAASGDGLAPRVETVAQAQGISARQLWAGRMVDTTGDLIPGTRSVTFVDWDTGDLAVRDLDSGSVRRLTDKGPWSASTEFALFSTVSPDGQRAAYAWFNQQGSFDLRMTALEGGASKVLHADPDIQYLQPFDWSPDGRQVLTLITLTNNVNRLVLISAGDGSMRVLKSTDGRFPMKGAFSPDGRFIVYDFQPREDASQRDLFLMAVDGTGEVPPVQHPANDYLPTWSPDGRSVVFLSDRAGTNGAWSMSFGAGGSLYYGLETGVTDLVGAAIDVAAGLVVTPPAPLTQRFVGANRAGDWSPDGRRLAYLSQRLPGARGVGEPSLVVHSLANGTDREFVLNLIRVGRPRWSPDSTRLLVAANSPKRERGMFAVDPDTGAASLRFALPGAPYGPLPVWSSDGQAVLYTYPDKAGLALRMRTLATAEERVLFRANVHNITPSPDGRHIAFTYQHQEGTRAEDRLVILPLAGGEPRLLTAARESEAFGLDSVAWTRDGQYILFMRGTLGQPRSLWRISPQSGEQQEIDISVRGNNANLRLHPDGRRLLFTSGEHSAEVWTLENLLPSRR